LSDNIYVVDTSSFIELGRKFGKYKDILVSLWKGMENLARNGQLCAPMKVYEDLNRETDKEKDMIRKWAEIHKQILFRGIDAEQAIALKGVIRKHPNWVNPETDKNEADPYVAALALAFRQCKQRKVIDYQIVVVTEESADPKRLKIPSVCSGYGIRSINLHDMFVEEGWKF
jgi:hypothetical protein